MREVPLSEAVGLALGHDLTQVVPGQFKGVRFGRGHIIEEADLPVLRAMGKEHLFVWELEAGFVHEQEAASRTAAGLAGDGLIAEGPEEGKVTLRAAYDGLLQVDADAVRALNGRGQLLVVTRPDRMGVHRGDRVAAVKCVPLAVPEAAVQSALSHGPVLRVQAFDRLRVALLTTGQEVYSGRVADAFRPRVESKLQPFGAHIVRHAILPDDRSMIAAAIAQAAADPEVDLILVTGGMSVDPDDRTPGAIQDSGAELVCHGTPVLPGSMAIVARHGQKPVLGLPACVIADPVTVFDLLLPRVLAGEIPTADQVAALGVGGLLEWLVLDGGASPWRWNA
ncbi:MAG: molybdopterin-binding protein [Sulfobacillus sp.]